MKVISVTNQKGGVGKTTTAINLSACLALSGRRVLVIDIDPQGNATSGLGVTLSPGQKGTYELLIGNASLREVIYPTAIETLKIIPASVNLSGAEIELVQEKDREKKLKNVLAGAELDFEFVIIDCPPSLGLLTLNAFAASNSALIPMQCEYFSLQGLSHLLKTFKLVKQSINPGLSVEGIVITMYDGRTVLAGQVREHMEKYFKDLLLTTTIPRNIRLSEAPSHGKPIVLYDNRSRGSDAYVELAKEIIARSKVNGVKTSLEEKAI